MLECVKVISQGFSHKKLGKPCQDAVSVMQQKGYVIISVADGHGGERYFRSESGAKIAVRIVEKEFEKLLIDISKRRWLDGKIDWEKTINALKSNIVKEWQNKVEEDFKTQKLNDAETKLIEELNIKFDTPSEESIEREEICDVKFHNSEVLRCYGTTLLSVLYIPVLKVGRSVQSFWITLQIGDGLTFALDENGEDFYPIPEDKNLGFGFTTSLCASNAAECFRHNFGFSKLNAIVVCSDGVADSFAKDKFGEFVKKIRDNISEKGRDAVQEELQVFFPKLSEQGSGDDVSLAGVFEINNVRT